MQLPAFRPERKRFRDKQVSKGPLKAAGAELKNELNTKFKKLSLSRSADQTDESVQGPRQLLD